MQNYPVRKSITMYDLELRVSVDRPKAGFSAWYEMFPRSARPAAMEYASFNDLIDRLPYVAEWASMCSTFRPSIP